MKKMTLELEDRLAGNFGDVKPVRWVEECDKRYDAWRNEQVMKLMNKMTLEELEDWLDGNFGDVKPVHWIEEYDSNLNLLQCIIYSYKDRHYAVYFSNAQPSEKWGDKGYERGVYQPVEVEVRHETVIVDNWYTTGGDNIDYFM
jgi:putative component of toxin-antitoxin plasmid stabilization module